MNYADIKGTSLYIAHKARQMNITQEEISTALYISQSQVSRVLSGNSKRASKVYIKICNYVNNHETGVSTEAVKDNVALIEAIASVWDGSIGHANALATVIRSLAVLHAD